MTKVDKIKNSAYMVLANMAIVFEKTSTLNKLNVINLKNTEQITSFRIVDASTILLISSNMSEANKYKSMLIVERNKSSLIGGYASWVNTQKSV